MDILTLLGQVFTAANKVMQRLWGDQTARAASLRSKAEEAVSKRREALMKLQEAQDRGDQQDVARYLSAANDWNAELKRLHDQAAAESRTG